jgi:hypothetical protein
MLLLAAAWTARAGLDDDSLVVYLPFDENGGDIAADASQYGHDGELVAGPSWVAGKSGSALYFDGSQDQYVQIPVTDTLQLTTAFTAAFWVQRADEQVSDWNYMLGAGTLKWATIYNANGSVYVWSTSGGGWGQRAMTAVPLTTDWTHVAVTYDVTWDVTVYFNAEPVARETGPAEVDAIDGSITIGARHPGQEHFTGAIDEVFLFSRAVHADEVASIMDAEFVSVAPVGKSATAWAAIKARR